MSGSRLAWADPAYVPGSRLKWAHPKVVARRTRRVLSPRVTFIERNHDLRNTLLLMSSRRSGSTWLSEMLAEKYSCRLIFEPFNRDKVRLSRNVPEGLYADPAEDDPELHRVVRRILTGRVRSCRWADYFNAYRFPRRRLVKEIRITNLLPWIHAQFPEVPVIYLLRHPIPASSSAARMEWDPLLNEFVYQDQLMDGPLAPWRELITTQSTDPDHFYRHVLRWCMENLVAISQLPPASVHVVLYEDLVENPVGELQRLAQYLTGFEAGNWAFDPAVIPPTDRPSRTNWLHTPVLPPRQRLQLWQQTVPPHNIERAAALLREFGLDRVYDGSARPLVPAGDVLQGHQAASPAAKPESAGPHRMQQPGTSPPARPTKR